MAEHRKTYTLTNSLYSSMEKTIGEVILKSRAKRGTGLMFDEVIVLPNQKVMDRVKSTLSQKAGDYSMSNLTTIDRLIQDTLGYIRAESGVNRDFLLSPVGKKHLLHNIIVDIKREAQEDNSTKGGRYLSRLLSPNRFIYDVSGLISKVKASYHKLTGRYTEGYFDPNRITPLLNKLHRGKLSEEKFTDIDLIIKRYEERKTELSLKDNEDMLIHSIHYLRSIPKIDSAFLRNINRIQVCGIHTLSTIHIDFLDALSCNMGCELQITMYAGKSNTHLINYMKELGFTSKMEMAYESVLHNLSHNLFKSDMGIEPTIDVDAVSERLNLIECPVMEDEVIAVSKKVKQLLREGKAEPEDILIVSSQLPLYKNMIRSTMGRMGIDVHISAGETLGTQKLVYVLLAILELKLNRFQYSNFIKLIKSNYVFVRKEGEYTRRYADVIEEFFANRKIDEDYFIQQIETYIKKVEQEDEENSRRYRIEELSKVVDYANMIKALLFPSDDDLPALPDSEEKVDFYDIWEGYKKLIEDDFSILLNVFESKKRTEDDHYYSEEELVIAKRDSIVFSKFLELIEEMGFYYNLLGEKLSLREFYSSLKQSLSDAVFHEDTDFRNKVQVYDVDDVSAMKFKYVFMVGMLENGFPRKHPTKVYISDKERTGMNRHAGFKIMETVDEFYKKEEDIFNMVLDIPEENIILSYPMEGEGKPTLKSFYIDEILELIRLNLGKEARVEQAKDRLIASIPDSYYYSDEFIEAVLKQYQSKLSRLAHSKNDPFNGVYQEKLKQVSGEITSGTGINEDYINQVKNAILMESAKESPYYTGFEGSILYDIGSLQHEDRDASESFLEYIFKQTYPTSLEMFGECPMRFFFNRVLNIREPETIDDVMDSRLKGTTIHYILERFYKEHVADRIKNADDTCKTSIKEELKGILDDIIMEEFDRLNSDNKIANRNIFQLNQLRTIRMNLSKYFDKDFDFLYENKYIPGEFEFSFGRSHPESKDPLLVYDDEGTLLVRVGGSIDRIDIPEDTSSRTEIKLSDYKTGSSKSKNIITTLIKEGRAFQPTLYCLKVLEDGLAGTTPEKLVWSYQYVLTSDKYPLIDIDRKSELILLTIEYIKEYRDKILQGKFHLAPKECSSYCKYRDVCGYVKNKTEEKGNSSGFWIRH
jgi:ATP-dependent helicase/nuclease subunit B